MTWTKMPLRAIYRRKEESSRSDLPLLSVYRDHGVVLREGRDDNFNRAGEDLSKYKVVQPGDLAMNKMKTWQGSLGVSRFQGIVSPAYFVGRKVGDADDRFLHHLLRSQVMIAEYAARSKGIRPNQWDLPWDEFAAIMARLPPLSAQRAIADYLDTETARIDSLIAKKTQLRTSLGERYVAVVQDELRHDEGIRLKHLLAAPLAYGVLVPAHDPNGVPMLRITDLRTGAVDLASVTRIPASLSMGYQRTILAEGDLVASVVGTLGRSLEVTADLAGSNLNRALARVQLKSHVPRSVIRVWFESDHFQYQARTATSGDSAQPTLGLGDMKNFAIGLPSDARRWPEIEARIISRLAPIDRARKQLHAQHALLREHREALITAAVTGESDVSRPA